MAEEVAMPPKRQGLERMVAVVIVIALACSGWALYEHRLNIHLNESLAGATARNAWLQQQSDDLQQQLTTTTTKLNELAQKNLPISLIYRPALSGNGLVTFFKNNAPAPIAISLVFRNPVTNHSREANLIIPANGVQSIGEAEGWVFAPGQTIQITNELFGTVYYVIPENK